MSFGTQASQQTETVRPWTSTEIAGPIVPNRRRVTGHVAPRASGRHPTSDVQGHGGEHPGPETISGIVETEPHREGVRCRVERGSELLDMASELLAGKRRDRRRDRLADADERQLVLEDLGIDPDVAQVGDLEQERPFRDILALIGRFLDDETADRRKQGQESVGAVVRGDRVDLILADSQDLERLGREPEPLSGISERRRVGIGPGRSVERAAR